MFLHTICLFLVRSLVCEDNEKAYCKEIGEGQCQYSLSTRRKCLWKCDQCRCQDECTDEFCTKTCKGSTQYICENIAEHRDLCPASCGLCGQGA